MHVYLLSFRRLLLLGVGCCLWVAGQHPGLAQPNEALDNTLLRVFLDCDDCGFAYVRREVPFVSYVREPQAAQVHVLVTEQGTGGGGRSYRLVFLGREAFAGQDQELEYSTQAFETDDQRREGLARMLKMGLMRYVAQTPLAVNVDIGYGAGEVVRQELPVQDPWNNWVFRIDFGGSFEVEETQSELGIGGGVRADRVTERWKAESELEFEFEEENFEDDDRTIRSTSREGEFSTGLVRSLSEHWSAGVAASVYTNTFTNTDLGGRLAPAVEYNVFPWPQSDRRAVTFGYFAGVRTFRYIEETLFERTAETRFYEALRLDVDVVQPWGEVEVGLEGSHYFHDPSKYLLEFDTEFSIRVGRGLSLDLELRAESIHDQLYLPKGDATLEEILLRRRQLGTTYEFGIWVGISYTFGSIYNTIVNPRL